MKFYAVVAFVPFVVSLLAGGAAQAQGAEAIAKAEAAASQWLSLTDSAGYGASWEQAAGLFKAAVSKANWESAIQGVRAPLGAVKSRKLKSAQFTKSLPGAPDGEYVVVQFETQFENKAGALETVTPLKERDGSWRVSGYYIK
jgi:type IV secretory pathway TrbL component